MSLIPGCYLMSFKPRVEKAPGTRTTYVGTFRVTGKASRQRMSGDLYCLSDPKRIGLGNPYIQVGLPGLEPWQAKTGMKKPSVPLFPLRDYAYYLEVLKAASAGKETVLEVRGHRFDQDLQSLVPGEPLRMKLAPAPGSAKVLKGALWCGSEKRGEVFLQWLSRDVRRAELRIISIPSNPAKPIRQPGKSLPKGVPDWSKLFRNIKWQLAVEHVPRSIDEFTPLKDRPWTAYDLGSASLKLRRELKDKGEWTYDLLCVSQFENERFLGVMFDSEATDLNQMPRESAAVAALQPLQVNKKKTPVQNLFGGTLYYRTAVHEVGHAMNLTHNLRGSTLMNVTELLLHPPQQTEGGVSSNARHTRFKPDWFFAAEDQDWLQHAPDIAVRPGGIARRQVHLLNQPRQSLPALALRDDPEIGLVINPVRALFPFGAPVRLNYSLSNHGQLRVVPGGISLRGGCVLGRVIGPDRKTRLFRSAFRCCESADSIEPSEPLLNKALEKGSMTLLRGIDGPLFPFAGAYRIELEIRWDADGHANRVVGQTTVTIQETDSLDPAQGIAASLILNQPSLMPALVQGLLDVPGLRALSVALRSPTLAPHYLAIALKCQAMGTEREIKWANLFQEVEPVPLPYRSRHDGFTSVATINRLLPFRKKAFNHTSEPIRSIVQTYWERYLLEKSAPDGEHTVEQLTETEVIPSPEASEWLDEVRDLTQATPATTPAKTYALK